MTAPVLDVDTSVYYDAGNKLVSLAADWFASVDSFWPTLNQCHAMTGSYDEAKKWAKTYDMRAEELLDMSNDLAEAVHAYGCVLLDIGYNHAVAENNATVGTADTPAPDKPATPGPVAYLCRVPPPSAGGPGQGLIDGGVQLAEAIGITIPDGNVDLLARAADTWTKIADAEPVAKMAGELERVAWSFEAIVSPVYEHIDEDLRALRDAALTTTAAFYELSASAKDHHDGLVELRFARRWTSWRGKAVEPLVRDALELTALAGALPWTDITAVGGWWNRAFNPEIDLIGTDRSPVANRVIFAGSIKWLGTPFDHHDLAELTRGVASVPGFVPHETALVAVSLADIERTLADTIDLVWNAADVLSAWS